MNPELYKPKDAAEYLSITKRALDSLRYRDRITYIKIGGSIRYRKSDLDAFLESCAVQPK